MVTNEFTRTGGVGGRHPGDRSAAVGEAAIAVDEAGGAQYLQDALWCIGQPVAVDLADLDRTGTIGLDERDERIDELQRRLPAQVDVVAVNATDPAAAQRLAPYLGVGQTIVLLGSSGAGKSTLTNTLLGASAQATGAVREDDSRGRHTTRARTLLLLPQGGCVIDTPGLRSLRPDVGEAGLAASFGDVDALALHCRYRNCTHGAEPGCAVRDAVDADRLRNYQKLLRDVRRDAMTALERQRQVAGWKVRSKAVRAYMKAKGRAEG